MPLSPERGLRTIQSNTLNACHQREDSGQYSLNTLDAAVIRERTSVSDGDDNSVVGAALLAAEHVEEGSAESCAQKAVDERVDRRVGEAKNLKAEPSHPFGKARLPLLSHRLTVPFYFTSCIVFALK